MKYTFYWLDGTRCVLEGENPADALIKSGYRASTAFKAIYLFIKGEDKTYQWDGKQWKVVASS